MCKRVYIVFCLLFSQIASGVCAERYFAFSKFYPAYKPLDKILNCGGIYACWEEVFEFLDSMGDAVDVNVYRWRQLTMLEMAVQSRNLLVAHRLLWAYSADPNLAGDREGMTPLMQACCAGDDAMAMILLLCGADPLLKDFRGRTALWHSIEEDNHRMASFLVGFVYEKNMNVA